MINIKKIRELYIANSPFDFLDDSNLKELNYEKWVDYIDTHQDYFTWEENTINGIFLKENINKVPEKVRKDVLSGLNKIRCNAEYNNKKKYYDIVVIFHKKLKRIVISFERKVKTDDLKLFLDMANYLDAYLLNNGTEIIDEKVIESLE
jgi:hypothetical protein